MKDLAYRKLWSHWFDLLFWPVLFVASNLPVELAGCAILAGDPYSKGIAGMIINRLPYARKEERSKK